MVDDKRIVFCLKLWQKEIQCQKGLMEWTIDDLNILLDNEIFNGEYCSDEEYNEYLITGKV